MKEIRKNLGNILIIVFLLFPIIIWSITPRIDPIFTDFRTVLISFGELSGIIGIIMFSINLILTTRLHFIEILFDGLNNIYSKHNLLGQISFVLLLFHPLLLLPRYSSSLKEASTFFLIWDSLALDLGIFSLAIMFFLIILTLFLRPKYNLWKITHKFFGFALFLGALHVYLIPSYIMNNTILKVYVLAFAVLWIFCFIYRSILGNFFIKRFKYIVKDIKKLNNKTMEISLKAKNKRMIFNSGQFIFMSFYQKWLSKEEHPFSISSSPSETILKVTIKILWDYTNNLFNKLKKGTITKIEGPFGIFSYTKSKKKNQIWIAGGIGITPFISFIEKSKPYIEYNIKLFYCVRNEKEAVYLKEFQEYEQISKNKFQVISFVSEKEGHINRKYIANQIDNLEEYGFLLCAPLKMIKELKKELISSGIKKNDIYSEEFNF